MASGGVLTIGLSAALSVRCAMAVGSHGVPLERAEIASAAERIVEVWPAVVVLLEDTYATDPARYDAMAKSVGAVVVGLPDADVTDSQLESRLMAAVAEAHRLAALH